MVDSEWKNSVFAGKMTKLGRQDTCQLLLNRVFRDHTLDPIAALLCTLAEKPISQLLLSTHVGLYRYNYYALESKKRHTSRCWASRKSLKGS